MEDRHITTDDVTQQIRKIKEMKSAGPDGINPDPLKILGNDIHCIGNLAKTINNIKTKEDNLSLVYMKDRIGTKTKDLRPIALINATYKLFMGIQQTKN